MSLVKYRLAEVAKDFGVPSKEISSLLSTYAETPKSNQKVLEDHELNIIFDAMTLAHQPEDFESAIKAAVRPVDPAEEAAKKAAEEAAKKEAEEKAKAEEAAREAAAKEAEEAAAKAAQAKKAAET
ncbi:MAG: translation initiation factor IF-2, partial [Clostridia bacterium]|nr:translation initiation factor IF-2 [Clostridia bacterium]